MANFIIKLSDKNKDYYMEWSTVSDSPMTRWMSLDDFKEYYKEEYWNSWMEELPYKLELVEEKWASIRHVWSLQWLLDCNHAKNWKFATTEEIIKMYCVESPNMSIDEFNEIMNQECQPINVEDKIFEWLKIMKSYVKTWDVITASECDMIWSVSVEELVNAWINYEDANKLRDCGWFVDDGELITYTY